jgi:hypothetical protein
MIKDACPKWLKWLRLLISLVLLNLFLKLKIELFIRIYNDIIELLFLLNHIKWIQNIATLDLGFNTKN